MKTKLLDINGKEKANIDLPKAFSKKIREDIVAKILEAKKTEQPFSPSPVAGKQHSASGTIPHRRHVWKTHYGKGMSRIPRKKLSRRGSQFNWVGAEIPFAVGGRRAHAPKVIARINTLKINKKELKMALESALSASVDGKIVAKKYYKLEGKEIKNIPLVVESKLLSLKTKELISSLKNILGKDLSEIGLKKKVVRKGKGKSRGRKYKSNAGLLLVIGNDEKIKTNLVDVSRVNMLSVIDLAKGGIGRLTVYTEKAIKDLGERYK